MGQFPCLEDEGSEESSPQVVDLTEAGGASEGMHPRLHDPRRRSAPKAAATADVAHLVEQGLVQSLGVFIDTLVICSATAFVILFDRSCTSRTREAREEAVAPTAFVGPTQVGTTPSLSFRAVLSKDHVDLRVAL